MIIHWTPCFDHRRISWEQPEPDKLIVRRGREEVAVDFSDKKIVEFQLELPERNYIHKAWREYGVLHVLLPSMGRLAAPVTIDHGEERFISWRK